LTYGSSVTFFPPLPHQARLRSMQMNAEKPLRGWTYYDVLDFVRTYCAPDAEPGEVEKARERAGLCLGKGRLSAGEAAKAFPACGGPGGISGAAFEKLYGMLYGREPAPAQTLATLEGIWRALPLRDTGARQARDKSKDALKPEGLQARSLGLPSPRC